MSVREIQISPITDFVGAGYACLSQATACASRAEALPQDLRFLSRRRHVAQLICRRTKMTASEPFSPARAVKIARAVKQGKQKRFSGSITRAGPHYARRCESAARREWSAGIDLGQFRRPRPRGAHPLPSAQYLCNMRFFKQALVGLKPSLKPSGS